METRVRGFRSDIAQAKGAIFCRKQKNGGTVRIRYWE